VIEGEQEGDGGIVTRRSGRHAAPPAGVGASVVGLRARAVALLAPVLAVVEPRIAAAAAWLFERRLHVLIVAASVATVAMLGGAVALISFVGLPRPPADGTSSVVDTTRPSSTDPASPNTYSPILPSPGPPPSFGPTSPTQPAEDPADPATDTPDDPTVEPAPTEEPAPETPPGATNRPDKPRGPDKPKEECEEQDGLLGFLLAPPCP
jgi:outer membrane biosynthesis protein TonB